MMRNKTFKVICVSNVLWESFVTEGKEYDATLHGANFWLDDDNGNCVSLPLDMFALKKHHDTKPIIFTKVDGWL